MTPTLVAAVVVGLIAPWVRSIAWGVPVSLLSIGAVLTSFVGSALTALLIGAGLLVLLGWAGASAENTEMVAGVAAGVGALLLLANSSRRMREIRGLSVLCQRLDEPDVQARAAQQLRRLLDRTRAGRRDRYRSLVLMAIGPLTHAGLWEEARARLRDLSEDQLSPQQAVLRDQALATCELHFDDVDAADAAIRRVPRPADGPIEVWLVAMEALLLAVRGDAEGALQRLGTQDTDDNPSLRASHRIVHAHVLAARKDEGGARRELEFLLEEAGRSGLDRVVRPRGPASDMAAHLLSSTEPQSG